MQKSSSAFGTVYPLTGFGDETFGFIVKLHYHGS